MYSIQSTMGDIPPSCNHAAELSNGPNMTRTNTNPVNTTPINMNINAGAFTPKRAVIKSIPIHSVEVPKFYIGSIPADRKPIYDVLGIKFVEVCSGNTTYFVLFRYLNQVIIENKLFA